MIRSKRSQVTMYIIVGIVILFALYYSVLISMHNKHVNSSVVDIKYDLQSVKDRLSYCIQGVTEDAVEIVGESGGYYRDTGKTTDYYPFIAYHYLKGADLSPAKEEVEKQISKYVVEKIPECAIEINQDQNEAELKSLGGDEVSVSIQDDQVVFDMYPKMSITMKDSTYYQERMQYTFNNVHLKKMLKIAKSIVEDDKNYDGICASCLVDYSVEYNVKILYNVGENQTVIYTIYDLDNADENGAYVFNAVHQY